MITQVKSDLEQLMSTIVNGPSKVHLRGIVGYQLMALNHPHDEVEKAMDDFFVKEVVH